MMDESMVRAFADEIARELKAIVDEIGRRDGNAEESVG